MSAGKVTTEMLPFPTLVNAALRRVGFDGAVVRWAPAHLTYDKHETWATAKTMADQRLLEELGWTPRYGGPIPMRTEPSRFRYSPPKDAC